jgi:hypothetical protein
VRSDSFLQDERARVVVGRVESVAVRTSRVPTPTNLNLRAVACSTNAAPVGVVAKRMCLPTCERATLPQHCTTPSTPPLSLNAHAAVVSHVALT